MMFSTRSKITSSAVAALTITVDGCAAVFLLLSFSSKVFVVSFPKIPVARAILITSDSLTFSKSSLLAMGFFRLFVPTPVLKVVK